MLECVVNVSEGQDADAVAAIAAAGGADVLDVHSDPHHHRSVLTLLGEEAARAVAAAAVERIDLTRHHGVHPRLGAVDVVPFVPLVGSTMDDALRARDAFAAWFAATAGVPCFLYGPERSLPDVRRHAFRGLAPDHGPAVAPPRSGATAVGARTVLVAYNVWLEGADLAVARQVAKAARRPELRALGLALGDRVQVSMNLVAPERLGPAAAYDLVDELARQAGAKAAGGELVGLVPDAILRPIPPARWPVLDLGEDRTIEARRAAGGGAVRR